MALEDNRDLRGEEEEESNSSDENKKNEKTSIHQIPEFSVLIFVAIGLGFYGLIFLVDGWTPSPYKISDEVKYPDHFIAERAQDTLRDLVAIGPRVVGTDELNIHAVEFLKKKIMEIKENVSETHEIDYDLQLVSGEYVLEFKPIAFVNKYHNMQNVVARLRPKLKPANYSLLLNCHIDSVPFSTGASDDGLSCSVMLEVMRLMAKSKEPLRANIIFLFNGAEENPLQAAHGFITGHPFAKTIHAFINMEAGGSGGRALLFQAGPEHPWLMKLYSKVAPHPYAQCLGEEVFQSGKIPSDSDFRLFRDFGKIPGMDMAFVRNGYVYHTRHDTFDKIPLGSFQHMGDNVLALTRNIAASDELENPSLYSEGKLIFYDVFGLFIISYSTTTALILNSIVTVASLIVIFISLWTMGSNIYLKLVISVVIQIVGWLFGIGLCIAISYIIDSFRHSLSWYYKTYLIFGIYFCPALIGFALPLLIIYNCQTKPASISLNVEVQMHTYATTLIWTIILIVMMSMNLRAAYLPMLIVLFSTVGHIINTIFKLQRSVHTWAWIYSVFAMFPALFSMYTSLLALVTLTPMLGRGGASSNVELVMGLLSALFCILISSCFVPLILLVRRPFYIIIGFALFSILSLGLVLLTPLGFPYSGNTASPAPQRYMIYHTHRTFYDINNNLVKNDSGMVFNNLDRNSPMSLISYLPELKNAQCLGPECSDDLFCGIPIYKTRISKLCKESTWIPFEKPVIKEQPTLRMIDGYQISASRKKIFVTVTGPDHINVIISPQSEVELIDWDIINSKPKTAAVFKGRKVYFISQSRGIGKNEWTFWMELEHPVNWKHYLVDVAITGHYMHNTTKDNNLLDQFVSKFPDWTHVMPFMATYTLKQY